MVIRHQTNVQFSVRSSQTYLPDKVGVIAKKRGKLYMFLALDYFIMSSGRHPWHRTPRDLVVARPGYDHFRVFMAICDQVSVIDDTKTLVAVHQTDVKGNHTGHRGNYVDFNMRQFRIFNSHAGLTSIAQYKTEVSGCVEHQH